MAINSYRASGQNQYGQMTDLDRRGAQINDANAQRRAAVQDQDWMLQNMLRQEATQKQQADRGFANADRSFGEGVRQFDVSNATQAGQFDKTFNRQGEQFDKNFLQQGQQFDTRTGQVDREFNENKSRYDSDPNRLKGKWINDQLGITGNGGWNPTDEAGQERKFTMAMGQNYQDPSAADRQFEETLLGAFMEGKISKQQMQDAIIARKTRDYSNVHGPTRSTPEAMENLGVNEDINLALQAIRDVASKWNKTAGRSRWFQDMPEADAQKVRTVYDQIVKTLIDQGVPENRARAQAQQKVQEAAGEESPDSYQVDKAGDEVRRILATINGGAP